MIYAVIDTNVFVAALFIKHSDLRVALIGKLNGMERLTLRKSFRQI